MFITNLFKLTHKCRHDHINPQQEIGYCPDCGQLIQNDWYITRCACCGVKLCAKLKNDEVVPMHKFCTNCGSMEYRVEKLDKINFIDINFAVLVKNVVEENSKFCSSTSCWQEKTILPPKLLVQYL